MKRLREQFKIFRSRPDLPFFQRVWKFTAGTLDAYHLHLSESAVTNIMAIVVGVMSGYGAVIFRWMLTTVTDFWGSSGNPMLESWFPWLGKFAFVPVPVIGMVLVALLVRYVAPEVGGSGIPEVMESVAMKSGRIRGRVGVVKAIASSICIGFGGSAGREGPIVQIGATFGSVFAGVLKMSSERRRWLVACGAGAGIAATFNTPIAGVIFAMEVILHGSTLRSFASVVLATVSGSVIGRMYFGDGSTFDFLPYAFESNVEIIWYVILGVAAGAVGILYTKSIYWVAGIMDYFKKVPFVVKAAIAGLLIGIVASIYPEVRGVGYEAISEAVNTNLVLQTMLVLMVVKIIATALTIGSGGSGGVFAPALFIGAMVGGVCGNVFEAIAPEHTAGSPPYVMVGMAAVFSAVTHAPLTAIFALFEMTGDYNMILPLMASVVIATVLSNHFVHESVFTMKLVRRGVRLRWGTNVDILESLKVRDVMKFDVHSVFENTPKSELYELFTELHHNGFPVLDIKGRLVGVVTLTDFYNAAHLPEFTPVDKFCSHKPLTVSPEDDLSGALKKMRIRDIGRLPVVSDQDPTHMVGIITRTDVLQAYEMALRRHQSDDAEMSMTDE